jgi:hypothetical protein
MSYIQGGTCPHCGAAIWYPAAWFSITPPPPSYGCSCRLQDAAGGNALRLDPFRFRETTSAASGGITWTWDDNTAGAKR